MQMNIRPSAPCHNLADHKPAAGATEPLDILRFIIDLILSSQRVQLSPGPRLQLHHCSDHEQAAGTIKPCLLCCCIIARILRQQQLSLNPEMAASAVMSLLPASLLYCSSCFISFWSWLILYKATRVKLRLLPTPASSLFWSGPAAIAAESLIC